MEEYNKTHPEKTTEEVKEEFVKEDTPEPTSRETFPEFIKAKRPELNPMLNKFKKKGRKLSKKLFIEKLKAKNVKEDIINEVKNGNEENAKTICVNALTKRKCAENSSKN